MSDYYVLNGKVPVQVRTVQEWGEFMEKGNRRVAQDMIGDVRISTVFLGLDHNFEGGGPPLLFETMIFGGEHDDYQERSTTWDEALSVHATAVSLVRGVPRG